MYRNTVLCVVLVLLQVLQGGLALDIGTLKFGSEGWTKLLSDLEAEVPQMRGGNPILNTMKYCSIQSDDEELCSFQGCVACDERSDAYASSICQDCLLELLALRVLNNATLRQEYCSDGVGQPECKFVTCVMKDPRGEEAAKAVGTECYRRSLSSSAGAPSAFPSGGLPPSSSTSGEPAASTSAVLSGGLPPSSSPSATPADASSGPSGAGSVSPSGLGSNEPPTSETSSGPPPPSYGSSLSDPPSSVPVNRHRPVSPAGGTSTVRAPPVSFTTAVVFGLTLVLSMK